MKHSHPGVQERGGRGEHEAMVIYVDIYICYTPAMKVQDCDGHGNIQCIS